jgi:nucleoside-diphosphate-sugar epimerase
MANPDTARDFVFVDDVVDAYLLAAADKSQEPGAIYNVGSGTQTNLREAVAVARRVLNLNVEPEWETLPGRSWDTDVWVAENSKFAMQFGWQPRFDFEKGFRATVAWFRNNPAMAARYVRQT